MKFNSYEEEYENLMLWVLSYFFGDFKYSFSIFKVLISMVCQKIHGKSKKGLTNLGLLD